MPEHQLFIADQAALDVMWDKVRPVLVAAERQAEGWPGFLRVAFLAGQAAAAVRAAAPIVTGMRELGQL